MMKKMLAKMLTKYGLKRLGVVELKRKLKGLVQSKRLKSNEAAAILKSLSSELMREKQRVRKFVRKEVRREARKARLPIFRLIELGAETLKHQIDSFLKPGKTKKIVSKVRQRFRSLKGKKRRR